MRKFLITISKKYPAVRIMRHYYVAMRNRMLWMPLALKPIQKNTVIFQAYNGRYTCSPKALYESMLRDPAFADYSFTWVVDDPARHITLGQQPRTQLVTIKSREYFRAYARSKYWIVNCMLPVKIIKRSNQTMVQCWHGTPLKRLRADIIEETQNAMNTRQDFIRKNKLDSARYDYLISPSRFATEKFVSAFAIKKMQKEGRILEIGYPRNDRLHTATPRDIRAIKRSLGLPANKKVILYAPTWRDDQHDTNVGYTHDNQMDFDLLRQAIGDEYVIVFRAHYLIANRFNFARHHGFVHNLSDHDDINDLYLVSDVLVTDYSSVMFDYANLNRPMIFYMYDRKHYEQNLRGFYLDIRELPGEIIDSQLRLIDIINDLHSYQKRYKKAYDAFAKKFIYLDDGHVTRRLKELIFAGTSAPPGNAPVPKNRSQSLTSQGPTS